MSVLIFLAGIFIGMAIGLLLDRRESVAPTAAPPAVKKSLHREAELYGGDDQRGDNRGGSYRLD